MRFNQTLMNMTTVVVGLLSFLMIGNAQASGDTLKVATYGGAYMSFMKEYPAKMFEQQTGDKVVFVPGNPSDHLSKMILSKRRHASVPFDVAILDSSTQAQAVRAGVLATGYTSGDKIGLKYLIHRAKPKGAYGPGVNLWSLGIVFNKDKLKEAGVPVPKSWADLWNPKLIGHVAIPDLSIIMGRCFAILLARKNGGGENNLKPGLEKIAKLKDVATYYTSSATLTTQLLSGDIWVAPWTNGRAWGMIDDGDPVGFVIPKEGTVGGMDTINIVKGTKHNELARIFIKYALDPFAQLGLAHMLPYGSTNGLLRPIFRAQPQLSKKFPWSKSELDKLYAPKWAAFNAKYSKYTALWNRVVLH